jgi:hypothetical protein
VFDQDLLIHVEVWLTAALMHEEGHATFSPGQLTEEVARRFGDTRPGVRRHISAHVCASAPKNTGTVYNYLLRTSDGRYRLYQKGDPAHSSRVGVGTFPPQELVPEKYWDLWRRWSERAAT